MMLIIGIGLLHSVTALKTSTDIAN